MLWNVVIAVVVVVVVVVGGGGGGEGVGLVDAKSNVNVYHFSQDCEGPGPAVTVPRWSIEPAGHLPTPGQGTW